MTLPSIYTQELPPMPEIEAKPFKDLQAFVGMVEKDVGLISEENQMFSNYVQSLRDKDDGARYDDDDAADEGQTVQREKAGGGKRKGRAYEKKGAESEREKLFLTIEEKSSITQAEQERLKSERDRNDKGIAEAKELFRATIEEATNRSKEIKMELAFFKREVAGDPNTAAEKISKYIGARPQEHMRQLEKLKEKTASVMQQIQKAQQQLRQREDVGEAFHAIDFDQLKIENHQFNERIDQKNIELVDLKTTTTRTVQTLNSLNDKLAELLNQQTNLKKDLKMREDYLKKLNDDIEETDKEFVAAKKKNTALKIQHESVKVPKVEDYIAQKAETYELQKAVQNWKRKVEIATGHMKVMKQQMISLRKKLGLVPN